MKFIELTRHDFLIQISVNADNIKYIMNNYKILPDDIDGACIFFSKDDFINVRETRENILCRIKEAEKGNI